MQGLLKYVFLSCGNKAISCLSPSQRNAIKITVKLFTQRWLLFKLSPLTPCSSNPFCLHRGAPKQAEVWTQKRFLKKQTFMGTVEFLPVFGLECSCMNYLKHCILVSDVSIKPIWVGEKSPSVFLGVFFWAPIFFAWNFDFLRESPFHFPHGQWEATLAIQMKW